MKLHPYLNYGGNCAEAFRSMKSILAARSPYDDQLPDAEPAGRAAGAARRHHVRIHRAGGTRVMGNDVPPERFQPMRSFYLCLSTENDAEAEHVYNLLAEGGEIFMRFRRRSSPRASECCATGSAHRG